MKPIIHGHWLCRWKCGRKTDRICRICLECCNERDAKNKRIDAGLEAYVPPTERPDHRFYKGGKRERTAGQKAALEKAQAIRTAQINEQNAPGEV